MKLPAYIMTEMVRRLEGYVPRRKFDPVLKATGLSLEEPGPPPDFENMEKMYEGKCVSGEFLLPAELKFLKHSVELHFRVSYAVPTGATLYGPTAHLDLLTWDESVPRQPCWSPVGMGVLSNQMYKEVWADISRHASQPDE